MAKPEGDDEQRYFSDSAVVRKIIPPFALLRLNSDVRGKLLGFLVCASQDRALRAINDERKAVYEDPLGKRSFYEKPRPPRAVDIGGSAMAELIGIYREAWKSAGHEGEGRIMLAFHMYCHEDAAEAARIARDPLNRYLKSLVDAASDWVDGAESDNYKNYGKMIAALDAETFESQVKKGAAWVGTPEVLIEQIRAYDADIGGFDDASLQVNFNDMSYQDAESSVRLFGEKVMPALG